MKVTERRTDNQPGAVRTFVFLIKRRAVPSAPFCPDEKGPNSDACAKAAEAAGVRTASNARVGGVNNIAAVGCVVGEWLENVEIVQSGGGGLLDRVGFFKVRLVPDFKVDAAPDQHHIGLRGHVGLFADFLGNE